MGGKRASFVRAGATLRRVLIALAGAALLFTRVISVRTDAEVLALAEEGVRRAAVECYALEGSYPALDDLEEHYGVTVDESRFVDLPVRRLQPDARHHGAGPGGVSLFTESL